MVGLVVAVDRNHALCYYVNVLVGLLAVMLPLLNLALTGLQPAIQPHTLFSQLGLGTLTLRGMGTGSAR
jgi:hypothetical protein